MLFLFKCVLHHEFRVYSSFRWPRSHAEYFVESTFSAFLSDFCHKSINLDITQSGGELNSVGVLLQLDFSCAYCPTSSKVSAGKTDRSWVSSSTNFLIKFFSDVNYARNTPDHSKNISTNRPLKKTHAVVVYDVEFSSLSRFSHKSSEIASATNPSSSRADELFLEWWSGGVEIKGIL